ncbi:MAG: RNA polymerase sigma-70 factor [Bacteroidales bacterium]|nr:RNA polymerase sigma-70 factor [Bacteroidales bacterium]
MSKKEYIVKQQYEELFRTHFVALCYFAAKYVSDNDTSKEIVHNVFISIWEKRNEFDFDKPAKSYLFTSVYNRCMNYIRDHKKFKSTDEENAIAIADSGEYQDKMETAELEVKIKSSINKLPAKCREVFMLNRFEDKKYAEIANQLNISIKTVEAQMSKALKILREELHEYLPLLLFLILNDFL